MAEFDSDPRVSYPWDSTVFDHWAKSQGFAMFSNITRHLAQFLSSEDGPTSVEYGIMLALIIVVCVSAVSTLGSNAGNTFTYVGSKVKTTGS